MSFKIVRNDITKMDTQAIVNTANAYPEAGPGCDSAIYKAAGFERLLAYRKEKIGYVPEGEVFITPGFDLRQEYIIHAVSPLYKDGGQEEEEKLRSCYRKSLLLARDYHIRSIAFPLISTGSFGYPKEEGMRIAVDEINAFLLNHEMEIILVVFGERATQLGGRIYPDLEAYIDRNYVQSRWEEEYPAGRPSGSAPVPAPESWRGNRTDYPAGPAASSAPAPGRDDLREYRRSEAARPFEKKEVQRDGAVRPSPSAPPPPAKTKKRKNLFDLPIFKKEEKEAPPDTAASISKSEDTFRKDSAMETSADEDFVTDSSLWEEELSSGYEQKLEERMRHLSDTFSQYLLYLIQEKKMENAEVYKRAIVDKKIFSKIKNNANYHPQKLTALCLCVGAQLNLDESKDLLARAGYALSPCDKTDIIFSFFIENGIYDMIELDIQLEEHGLPCIIS